MSGEAETKAPTPESVDMADAVARMDEAIDHEPESAANETGSGEAAGDEVPVEEPAAPEEAAVEGAPEFWSAEDKAAWDSVPPELRPVLKKYEQQRVAFVNEKAREAAALRAEVDEEVRRAHATADQAAAWWQHNGPALQKAVGDKWAKVDWKALAEKDPAEYARLDQQRREELALAAEADRRGQEEVRAAEARARQDHERAKAAEFSKLAARLPDYFGTAEATHKTYGALATFLLAKASRPSASPPSTRRRSSSWRSMPGASSRPGSMS